MPPTPRDSKEVAKRVLKRTLWRMIPFGTIERLGEHTLTLVASLIAMLAAHAVVGLSPYRDDVLFKLGLYLFDLALFAVWGIRLIRAEWNAPHSGRRRANFPKKKPDQNVLPRVAFASR